MVPPQIPIQMFDLNQIELGEATSLILTFDTEEEIIGEIPLRVIRGKEAGPILLILAAVHGDEYDGVRTVIELCNALRPEHIRGTILMVPVTNRLSYEGISRETPLDGRNLAREFPGKQYGSYTQRLAWYIDQYLLAQAEFLLDFHSGGMEIAIPLLVGYYHNDEEEHGRRSRAAAEVFGVDTVWAHPEVAPGRTVTAATERGIPWLYTEAGGGRRIKATEQESYRIGAYRLMQHLGMLMVPQQWVSGSSSEIKYRLIGDGNFDESLQATTEGFFIPAVQLLQSVKPGDTIGIIYGMFGEELQTIIAPTVGVIVGLAEMPIVHKGSPVCAITPMLRNRTD